MCHTRAGAWIELSCLDEGEEPFGLVDHAGPLLGQVAEPSSCVSNSVIEVSLMPGALPGQVSEEKSIIFSTYCLEERRKWNGSHDGDSGAKDLDKEEAERFVQTLIEFAGDDEGFSMGKQQKPRTFQFDISEVVRDLDLDLNSSADEIWERAEEEKKQALGAKASKGKKSQDKNAKKREKLANCKRFWPVAHAHKRTSKHTHTHTHGQILARERHHAPGVLRVQGMRDEVSRAAQRPHASGQLHYRGRRKGRAALQPVHQEGHAGVRHERQRRSG